MLEYMNEFLIEKVSVGNQDFLQSPVNFVIFTKGDITNGQKSITDGIPVIDTDPHYFSIDDDVTHLHFEKRSILIDSEGNVQPPISEEKQLVSFNIYCGTSYPTNQALEMFEPDSWQYATVKTCFEEGIKRVSVTPNGYVEGMESNGLTLKEYSLRFRSISKIKYL